VSSSHADPQLNVRPPADLKAKAHAALVQRRRGLRGFVVACLSALVADPDGFLEGLAAHWPAEKPRGNPRHSPAPPP
jgi:hypothetical protein